MIEPKIAVDTVLASAALSSPAWIQLLERQVGLYALIAGAVLLTLRIGLAVREYWRKK